ncbi:MAG: ArnT family glycosyltransferase [Tepidisphaeraceae bacterium]
MTTATFGARADLEATGTRRQIPWPALSVTLFLLGFAAFLFAYFAPAISDPDDNGYFAQASLLAQTGHTWFAPESDAQFIGMHWLITPTDQYISRYPPGLSVLIAGIYKFAGYKIAVATNPALAIATLLGTYLLARRYFSSGWALTGVFALAVNPTFVRHALSGDAHMAVALCVAWGTYFLVRWSQDGRTWQIFLAGLVFGSIPAVRYPDSLIGLGVIAFLWLNRRTHPKFSLHTLAAVLGAAVSLVPLLIHNQLLLGAFWRTAYALTNEQTGFAWQYFREHAIDYVRQIGAGGVGLLFAPGVVGIAWMCTVPRWRALGTAFAFFIVPLTLLYMAYYWAPPMNAGATMRFLLPTFPVYAISAIWMLDQATRAAPNAARVTIPIVLVGTQLLWGASDTLEQARQIHYQKQMLALATDAISKEALVGDVIVSNPQILQQLDYVRQWKLADPTVLRGGMGMRFGRENDPDAPSPMQPEKRTINSEKYSGSQSERVEKFADDVSAWAAGRQVWFIGAEREMSQLTDAGEMEIVARVSMPKQPVLESRDGPFGRGRGPGGPPGGRRGGWGPGGGPFGMLTGTRELIIARWTTHTP